MLTLHYTARILELKGSYTIIKDQIVAYITFALAASLSALGCSPAMWLLQLAIGTDIPHRKQLTVGPSSTLKDSTFNCYFKVYNNFHCTGGGTG